MVTSCPVSLLLNLTLLDGSPLSCPRFTICPCNAQGDQPMALDAVRLEPVNHI